MAEHFRLVQNHMLRKIATSIGVSVFACAALFGLRVAIERRIIPNFLAQDEIEKLPPGQHLIDAATLSTLVRINPESFVGLDSIADPQQRHIMAEMFIGNDIASKGGIAAAREKALNSGNAYGWTHCSDSRSCFANIIPAEAVEGEPIYLSQTSRIGPPPVKYDPRTKASFFVPHCISENNLGGCGAGGAVNKINTTAPGVGRQALKDAGIAETTLKELDDLVAAGDTVNPKDWSRVGATIQARMNNHDVFFGVYGMADDTFTPLGVVDAKGIVHDFNEPKYAKLKAIAQFMHQPREVVKAIVDGQAPKMTAIIGSRKFSARDLFGPFAAKQSNVFNAELAKTPGKALTVKEAAQAIGSGDYCLAHLAHCNVLTLVADTREDMAVLKSTLLTEGAKDGALLQFLQGGGTIVEVIPNAEAKFTDAIISNAQKTKAELERLNLLKRGLISTKMPINDRILKEAEGIVNSEKAAGKVTVEEASKLKQFFAGLKQFKPLLRFGLQISSDYMSFQEFADFVDKWIRGYDLVYTNSQNRVVFSKDARVLQTIDEQKIAAANSGADPYLISGMIDHIDVMYDELRQAYAGAANAWRDRGMGGKNESSPWKDVYLDDLGKFFEFKVKTPNKAASETTHQTFLVIRPGVNSSGRVQFDYQDPHQLMRLDDFQQGLIIPGNAAYREATIIATRRADQPNLIYLWSIMPKKDRFELRFIQAIPLNPKGSYLFLPETMPEQNQFAKSGNIYNQPGIKVLVYEKDRPPYFIDSRLAELN